MCGGRNYLAPEALHAHLAWPKNEPAKLAVSSKTDSSWCCSMGNGINWKGQVFPQMKNFTSSHKVPGQQPELHSQRIALLQHPALQHPCCARLLACIKHRGRPQAASLQCHCICTVTAFTGSIFQVLVERAALCDYSQPEQSRHADDRRRQRPEAALRHLLRSIRGGASHVKMHPKLCRAGRCDAKLLLLALQDSAQVLGCPSCQDAASSVRLRRWPGLSQPACVTSVLYTANMAPAQACLFAQAHPGDVQGEKCFICGKGDDSGSDWISCDKCEHWVHFSCDKRTDLAPYKVCIHINAGSR